VKRKCEREPAQEQDEREGENDRLPLQMNRNVERTRSRWCVVRDARHTYKTQAPVTIFLYRKSVGRGIGGSVERTLAQASVVTHALGTVVAAKGVRRYEGSEAKPKRRHDQGDENPLAAKGASEEDGASQEDHTR
jgi:hypothetical protein